MKALISVGSAVAILYALTLLLAPAAGAQQRMSSIAGRSAASAPYPAATHVVASRTPAPRRTAPAVWGSSVHFNAATHSFELRDGTPISLGQLLNPFPERGPQDRRFSALDQNLGMRASLDPSSEWKSARARRVPRGSRFAGPGFYILDGGLYYPVSDDSSEQSSEAASDQSSDPQQPQVQQPQSPQPDEEVSAAQEQGEEQLPDVGQFTLVLRNGNRLEAVAFSHVNDQIIYITTDGSRRSFPATDLNSDATVEINGERGTPLQLPL
jgi:hypothetical protein